MGLFPPHPLNNVKKTALLVYFLYGHIYIYIYIYIYKFSERIVVLLNAIFSVLLPCSKQPRTLK